MLTAEENTALALRLRQDLSRPSITMPKRYYVQRAGTPARSGRTEVGIGGAGPGGGQDTGIGDALPGPGTAVGGSVGGTTGPVAGAPSVARDQYGLAISLKARISGVAVPTTVVAMSDWLSMVNYVAHITLSCDVVAPMTDGVRLFAYDGVTPPPLPGGGSGRELILAYSSANINPPYPAAGLQIPGSPGYSVSVNMPCLVPVPYARWRLLMYYFVAEPIATDFYVASVVADLRQAAVAPGLSLAFPPVFERFEVPGVAPVVITPVIATAPPLPTQRWYAVGEYNFRFELHRFPVLKREHDSLGRATRVLLQVPHGFI